ncbi:MFS transporter [Nocardioides nanhaiensis]|uniref:MFS transporter n=1 Tax=Nocardioides nanhaiensis TaxID=1476871 RepID=A0ABP8VQU5_9ACTN
MNRAFTGWLGAGFLSTTGTRVSMVALPLFALELTGSAALTGLVALCEMAPLVLLKVLGGPIIDRVGPRRVALTCEMLSVVAVGSIPALHLAGALTFPLLLVLVAVAGALRGPGESAQNAMSPALAAHAGVPLERVTGLDGAAERTASMTGAALAGILVASVGAAEALVVNAGALGVAALVLAWATAGVPVQSTAAAAGEVEPGEQRYLDQLREGWRFLRSDPLLLGITVMVALTNLLDMAWSAVLMPVWAVTSGEGAAALGLLLALMSGCSALGAACAAAFASRLPRYTVYLVGFLLTGLPRFAIFVVEVPLVAVAAVFAVAGFASGFLNPVLGAVIFERIPAPLVGRVSSLSTALCFALMPLGGLVGGLLVESWGLAAAMLTCGVAYLLVTTAPALDPRWRELDRRPEPLDEASRTGGLSERAGT